VLGSLFAEVYFFSQLLQNAMGYDALGAGLRLIPWTGTFLVVGPVAGALTDRIGERPLMVSGLLIQAGAAIWIALIASPDMAYSQLVVPMVIAGVGISMALPSAQNSVLGSVSEDAVGKAAGTNTVMRELGGVFGIAVSVAVFAAAGSYATPQTFVDGFGPAIGVAAALAVVGAIAGTFLPAHGQETELIGSKPTATTTPALETE
jgi:MFS family permease